MSTHKDRRAGQDGNDKEKGKEAILFGVKLGHHCFKGNESLCEEHFPLKVLDQNRLYLTGLAGE